MKQLILCVVLVLFILCVVLVLLIASIAQANQITLQWDDPNNSPGTVVGYKIYQGTTSGEYDKAYDAGLALTFTTPDLPVGTYYFSATAYNAAGESKKSVEASVEVKPPIVLEAPVSIIIRIEPK